MQTYSQKQYYLKRADWGKRLAIASMRHNGLTIKQIAAAIGSSESTTYKLFRKIKHMSLEQIKEMKNKYQE